MSDNSQMIANFKKYALIRNNSMNEDVGYTILNIKDRAFVILENYQEAVFIIDEWLKLGIEVFNSQSEFDIKYPPISSEERIAKSRIFWWEKIPKEEWTKEIREYCENDPYWQEFRIKNNLG